MIKSILVPMGSSIFSQAALKTAASLAESLQAELRLLHVKDLRKVADVIMAFRGTSGVSLDLSSLGLEQEELKAIQGEMEKEKQAVQKYYDDVKADLKCPHSLIFREGDVPDEILAEIRRVDLVVMGKSLRKESEECGKIAPALMKVIHRTSRALLAVCAEGPLEGPVLICYDGSRSANNSLRVLCDLAPLTGNPITVLMVAKSEEEARPFLEEAAAYLQSCKVQVEKVWKSGHAADVILQTAREKKAAVIVMGGYGDNMMKELLLGSVTEKVLRSTDIPVLLSNR